MPDSWRMVFSAEATAFLVNSIQNAWTIYVKGLYVTTAASLKLAPYSR